MAKITCPVCGRPELRPAVGGGARHNPRIPRHNVAKVRVRNGQPELYVTRERCEAGGMPIHKIKEQKHGEG